MNYKIVVLGLFVMNIRFIIGTEPLKEQYKKIDRDRCEIIDGDQKYCLSESPQLIQRSFKTLLTGCYSEFIQSKDQAFEHFRDVQGIPEEQWNMVTEKVKELKIYTKKQISCSHEKDINHFELNSIHDENFPNDFKIMIIDQLKMRNVCPWAVFLECGSKGFRHITNIQSPAYLSEKEDCIFPACVTINSCYIKDLPVREKQALSVLISEMMIQESSIFDKLFGLAWSFQKFSSITNEALNKGEFTELMNKYQNVWPVIRAALRSAENASLMKWYVSTYINDNFTAQDYELLSRIEHYQSILARY